MWRYQGGGGRCFVGLDKTVLDNKVASGMSTGNQVKFGVSKARSLSAWSMRRNVSKFADLLGKMGDSGLRSVAKNKVGILMRQENYLLGGQALGRGRHPCTANFFFKRLLTD